MFNILKKKKTIVAPVSGQVIPLSDVKDEVFSSGMMGDGIAIQPTDDIFVAPCDGEIVLIPETKHAFGIKSTDGIELLIHIGLDTVMKKGQGFQPLVKVGDKVKKGTPVIKVDVEFFHQEGISLVTPVIILNDNGKNLKKLSVENCQSGTTTMIEF